MNLKFYFLRFAYILALVCHTDGMYAQTFPSDPAGSLSYPVNQSFVLYEFADNRQSISELHRYIRSVLAACDGSSIRFIEIVGYSSPEGDYGHNASLAAARAESLKSYVLPFFPDTDIRVSSVAEDWEGLSMLVSRMNHPQAEKIRSIACSDIPAEMKEKSLRGLADNGYREISRSCFPMLRRATLTVHREENGSDLSDTDLHTSPVGNDSLMWMDRESHAHSQSYARSRRSYHAVVAASQYSALDARSGDGKGRFYRFRTGQYFSSGGQFTSDAGYRPMIGVGTNLLEWAGFRPDFTHTTFILNVYLEYYFLHRFSVKGAFSYCDRKYDGSKFQGISSYILEPRFWFLSDGSFRGFLVGAYGQMGDFNNRSSDGNHTGKFYSVGLSAGYLLPVYKGLALELGLRGGYRHSDVKRYRIGEEDCTGLCKKFKKDEFTVTGVCLNLIYRFQAKNSNKQ